MIEKARQDLETNIRSSDKSEYTSEAEEVTGKYLPRGERDVIRLRNPTEDFKCLSTDVLTSADPLRHVAGTSRRNNSPCVTRLIL